MASGSFYKAVWRWHFYAGVFSIPFLLLLSATGAIYLFDTQIEERLYRDYYFVTPLSAPVLGPSALQAALPQPAAGEVPITYFPPAAPDRSSAFTLLNEKNEIRSVYINPYTGSVLGSISSKARLMDTVKRLHNLEIVGTIGNRLVECIAGWAIILFITGVYLWWPKSVHDAVRIRGGPGQRAFWRDVHRVVGIAAGGAICFQAATGLPWSGVFGDKLRRAIDATGQGIPSMVRDDRPESTMPPDVADLDIGLDKAVAVAVAKGMPPGYGVSIPSVTRGVYTAMMLAPDDPAQQRVIHIDRYSGKVLADIGFKDYGGASGLVELGFAIHMGNYFGTANRLVNLGACIAVWVLCATGMVMWWKRRPKDSGLTALPPPDRREARAVFVITLAISLLFPLTALSLALLVVVDRFGLAGWGTLRGALRGI